MKLPRAGRLVRSCWRLMEFNRSFWENIQANFVGMNFVFTAPLKMKTTVYNAEHSYFYLCSDLRTSYLVMSCLLAGQCW